VSSTSRAHAFTGLPDGFYSAFVVARPNDSSVQSNWSSFYLRRPDRPTVTSVVANANGTVTINWTGGNSNTTHYDVYIIQAPWGWDNIVRGMGVPAGSRTHTFTGVPHGFYSAFVISRPNDSAIQSNWSSFYVR